MRPPRFVAGPACRALAVAFVAATALAEEDARAPAAPAAEAGGGKDGKLDPLPPAQQLLERARETLDDVMRRAAQRNRAAEAAAEAAQRAQFIRQQAQQFENMLQPLLTAELALVRRACGSLPPEARKEVLAASRQGVRDVAQRVARLQLDGAGVAEPIDVRRVIHERVVAAVEPRADAAEFVAYESESRQRRERREEAARIQIVLKLDERLGLTASQRQDVLADLRTRWQPPWIRELEDHGVMSNDMPLAPDFAEACIAPHLDAAQLRSWRHWCESASAKGVPMNGIDWSEFNTLQQHPQKLDAWWRP
ncbi:MAG: hypothetical protein ACKOZU_05485 [Planctomycetaceae bacterium]